MSTDVRVHVRLGAVRVVFEGEQSFYEKHVESLVDAAAKRGKTAPKATDDPPADGYEATARNGSAPADAPSAATPAPRATPPAPVREGFVPASGEFGRYIRRLGPEASDSDRQVVALAFYLWNYEKRSTFGVAELEGCFRALGLPLPPGIADILSDLTDRKRFLEAAEPGAWRLSRKGENYVKTRLLAA